MWFFVLLAIYYIILYTFLYTVMQNVLIGGRIELTTPVVWNCMTCPNY